MSGILQEVAGQKVWVWTQGALIGPSVVDTIGNKWMKVTSAIRGPLLLPLVNLRCIEIKGGGMIFQAASGGLSPAMIGHKVRVTTLTADGTSWDAGLLEAFDDDWLRLGVKNKQLYLPISSIVDLCVVQ